MAELGKSARLMILRDADQGFYLDGGELGELLLPTRYIPEDVEQGDEIDVFIYCDSDDRIITTTEIPICEAGQFATFEVLEVNRKIGAFLDWGLSKDLLLPFREQTQRVIAGSKIIAYVMVDERSNRIIATTKTNRFLNQTPPPYQLGDEVPLLIHEKTPLGYNAIVNHQHLGLLYHSELNRPLRIGQTTTGYVRKIRERGKIDLSLEKSGRERVVKLTDQILEALEHNGGHLSIGDKSSPQEINKIFGTSKKAFKQAVGALYKQRKIIPKSDSIQLVKGPNKME